jgi:hypothetical protein
MLAGGMLDSSNYPTTHPLHSNKYKAQLGCVKDESAGCYYKEWLLLRPKLYSFKAAPIDERADKKVAKGVQKAALRRQIQHADYVRAFTDLYKADAFVRRISSHHHNLFTVEQRKRALTVWEDKRAWVEPNRSLPFGHVELSTGRDLEQQQRARKRKLKAPLTMLE